MEHSTEAIEAFLRAFEHDGNQQQTKPQQIDAEVSRFAETFLVAGPDGPRVIRASDFALALPKRRKMFDEWGLRSTKLDSTVVTKLDERYVMAETKWLMSFGHGEGQLSDVLLGSTYILDTKDELNILFYLSHQDIVTVLKERGILGN